MALLGLSPRGDIEHRGDAAGLEVAHPNLLWIFSVQVFASRSEARATKLANALAGADGWYRVVLGVYDSASAARAGLSHLKRTWKLEGFVREL